MKRYYLALLGCLMLFSCEKNMVSKVPHISLMYFGPPDSLRVNVDTAFITFKFTDGDANIGNDTVSVIHIKDSRYDTFAKYRFPDIDAAVEDAKKGLTGTCYLEIEPGPVPRDSAHQVTGDTLYYEFYITDRAGNESNHEKTHSIIIRN